MNVLFEQRNTLYNLRSQTYFTTGPISIVNNGLKSLRYLGLKIWNIIPPAIRISGNTEEFTRKSKFWIPKNCSYKLCLNYIHIALINQPYFWTQLFKGALVNRKRVYFSSGSNDGCFWIKILFIPNLFMCF